jgi:hypothetical protein
MQSLRDILPIALTPPHAHGTALVTYQTRILHLRGRDSSGMRSSSSYRVTIVHDHELASGFNARDNVNLPFYATRCVQGVVLPVPGERSQRPAISLT